MLNAIKEFFDIHLNPRTTASGHDAEHALRLAVAALLIEVAESDYRSSAAEREGLLSSLHRHFGIQPLEAETLISLAQKEHASSTDYFQFTQLINRNYTPERKIRLIEAMWRVAFSDRELHSHEEHVIRRISGLLHVSHKDFIAAKHRAKKGLKSDRQALR